MFIKPIAMAAAAGLLMTSAAYAGDKDHKDKTAAAAELKSEMSATAPTTVNPTAGAWSDQAASATAYSSDVAAIAPALSSQVVHLSVAQAMSGMLPPSGEGGSVVYMSAADALAAGGTVYVISSAPVPNPPVRRAR